MFTVGHIKLYMSDFIMIYAEGPESGTPCSLQGFLEPGLILELIESLDEIWHQ